MGDLGWFVAEWALLSLVAWALGTAVESFLGRRLGAGVRRAVWVLILVRMVVPWGPVAWSGPGLPSEGWQTPDVSTVSVGSKAGAPGPSASALSLEPLVGPGIWALGVALVAATSVPARRRWAWARRSSLPLEGLQAKVAAFEAPGTEVRRVPGLASPCIAGLGRPVIYLPDDPTLDETDLAWMLRHEVNHRRRDDLWVLAFARTLRLVFWFLPGVWLSYGRLVDALEAGCDERTLWGADSAGRMAYGTALLRRLESRTRQPAPALGMASGFGRWKVRMASIRRPGRTTAGGLALVLFAALATGALGLPTDLPPTPGWPFAPGTQAWVTLGFGPVAPGLGLAITNHPGIDLAARQGTPIRSPWPGTVAQRGSNPDDGEYVEVDLGAGWTARFSHLAGPATADPGSRVAAGTPLGRLGSTGVSTGPHVQIELRHRGEAVDPAPFLSP